MSSSYRMKATAAIARRRDNRHLCPLQGPRRDGVRRPDSGHRRNFEDGYSRLWNGYDTGRPYKEGPGEINVPIACGGIHIEPGDIILGDADGIIVIPRRDAAEILAVAGTFSANDAAKVTAAANGTADRSWVDKTLAAKNCEIIDAVYSE